MIGKTAGPGKSGSEEREHRVPPSYPWYSEDVTQYPAGTLIIDVVDTGDPNDESDDTLVFRGTATALLPAEPEDAVPEIERAVTDVFRYWPTT